jgi:methionyl-tRNA synthetase
MYVWFDALSNYWSALGGWDSELTARFWPTDANASPTDDGDLTVVHLVGKDILRFHAVFWPAFLMSAKMAMPSKIYAHGFLTIDGQKMSKSLRNAVDPVRLAAELPGGPSTLRYHLLRAIAFGQDGDFDHAALLERYNADLGKNLGNLLSRVLGLCVKNTGNNAPAFVTARCTDLDRGFLNDVQRLLTSAQHHWDAIEPHRALEATWAVSSRANLYVDQAAPWAEAKKGDAARVETILATLVKVLEHLSVYIAPALPDKANAMRAQLGLGPLAPALNSDLLALAFRDAPTRPLGTASPLFPTLDAAGQAALLERLVPRKEPVMNDAATPFETAPTVASGAVVEPIAVPITYDQFAATDLRIGVVLEAEKVPKKDKLLKLKVDIGDAEPRQIVAGLALSFAPEALVGKRVVVVTNLAPRDFGKGLVSHGMLLAAGESNSLSLATVTAEVAPGTKVK